MLAETPRSGFAFLGSGKQSVAEHSYRTALISYALAEFSKEKIDRAKILMLSLVHDLPEARTSDLNYVNKRYVRANEDKAVDELSRYGLVGRQLAIYIQEYRAKKSIEAVLVHDADQLELLLCLKKEYDTGNPRALVWFDSVSQRLETKAARQLAVQIRSTPFDEWWLEKKSGNKKPNKKDIYRRI